MSTIQPIKLGSLFDGIGGFPYAASFYGIKAVWASEILPAAVSVTRRHFPDMLHVGDIIKLSGELLPPVDIVCFGSPCQDLSVAKGRRDGLSGARSGLFYEAIRIIKEMREATNGKYPAFALWENVPGALHSRSGSDFKAVLEAFTEAEIPMPPSGRWANAGMVRGRGVDLAWCVYNAADFGLAQRRKRVFAVADFTGSSAGKILFVPKSLPRHFAAGPAPGEGPAAAFVGGADGADTNCLTPWDTQQKRIYTEDGPAPTLTGADGGGGRNPAGLVMRSAFGETGRGYWQPGVQTIRATGENHPGSPSHVVASFIAKASAGAGTVGYSETEAPTLRAGMVHCVCEPDIARTLTARGDSSPCADRGQNVVCVATTQVNAEICKNLCPTITEAAGNSGNNKPYIVHPDKTGTLCGSAAGLSRPAGMASETELCVAVAVDCLYMRDGTLQAKANGGYSLNCTPPVRIGYTVRRLTPIECERLMGLEDGYTAYGDDGKAISDSKRYAMLGNSVAIPCVAHIMRGIAEELNGRAANNK